MGKIERSGSRRVRYCCGCCGGSGRGRGGRRGRGGGVWGERRVCIARRRRGALGGRGIAHSNGGVAKSREEKALRLVQVIKSSVLIATLLSTLIIIIDANAIAAAVGGAILFLVLLFVLALGIGGGLAAAAAARSGGAAAGDGAEDVGNIKADRVNVRIRRRGEAHLVRQRKAVGAVVHQKENIRRQIGEARLCDAVPANGCGHRNAAGTADASALREGDSRWGRDILRRLLGCCRPLR